jgi:hypothetical protein
MKSILKIEGYVEVPSYLKTSVSYKIAYLMKEEIRNYKWYEGEKKRDLTWEEAVSEWNAKHRAAFDRYINDKYMPFYEVMSRHTMTYDGYTPIYMVQNPIEQYITFRYMVEKHPYVFLGVIAGTITTALLALFFL